MIKGVIFDWIGTLYERDKGLFPDSERVVIELSGRGYKLGLVSLAKDEEARDREIIASGIHHYFAAVIVSDKKTPAQYMQCMDEMKTAPEDTSIVDDRTRRGIQIGNKLGCRTFWISEGEYAHELPDAETGEPDYRIKSIVELLDYLK